MGSVTDMRRHWSGDTVRFVDLEDALRRTAAGDYSAEASVLLIVGSQYWLPRLVAADLIDTPRSERSPRSGRPVRPRSRPTTPLWWAAIAWGETIQAVLTGQLAGSASQLHVLQIAASIGNGYPVNLDHSISELNQTHMSLVLTAFAHASGPQRSKARAILPRMHAGRLHQSASPTPDVRPASMDHGRWVPEQPADSR